MTQLTLGRPNFWSRVAGFVELTRPWWVPFSLIKVMAPVVLATGGRLPLSTYLYIVLMMYTAMGGFWCINDYLDRRGDRLTHPTRPIPSGRVSPSAALIFGVLLLASALVLALLIHPRVIWFAALTIVIFVLHYGLAQRKTPVFMLLMVGSSWLVLAPYLTFASIDSTILLLVAVNFIWDIGHDVSSDIRDHAGDRQGEKRTFATWLGPRFAAWLVFLTMVVTLLLSAFFGFYARLGWVYGVAIVALGVPYAYRTWQLTQKPDQETGARAYFTIGLYQLIQFLGIIVATFVSAY